MMLIFLCCVIPGAFIILHPRSLPPYVALTTSTISRGWVKINVSFYMIKSEFVTLTPRWKKWFPCACLWDNTKV